MSEFQIRQLAEEVQLMTMNHPATIRKENEGRRIGIVGGEQRREPERRS